MTNPVLSISILISNRPDTVRKCLDSIQPLLKSIPSELILTDTGCGEEVRNIIEEYADHIIDFTWCNDFSAARNVGLRESKGQWFMYLDDDEWFEDTQSIIDFFQSGECDNYGIACYVQRNYYAYEENCFEDHWVDRILRNTPNLHFEHRIHEAYTNPDMRNDGRKKRLGSFVRHYGYIVVDKNIQQTKYERNQALLELECSEHPEDMRMWYQLITNYFPQKKWDAAIEVAIPLLQKESDSEYWDLIHTALLHCLEEKKDWKAMEKYCRQFFAKEMHMYEIFGTMQYALTAFWHLENYKDASIVAEEVFALYEEYKKNPDIFHKNQISKNTFFQMEYIDKMLCLGLDSAVKSKNLKSVEKLLSFDNQKQLQDILLEHRPGWMMVKQAVDMILPKIEDTNENQATQGMLKLNEKRFDNNISFFDGERRCGFYIEPMIKNAWAANIRVLNLIDQICKAHNISYWADWGTLLGTVRHHGYIPWDDDIDICMKREDLYRFYDVIEAYNDVLVCINEFNCPTDRGARVAYVTIPAASYLERRQIKENYGFAFGGGVDIFTLDYVPRDDALRKEQIYVYKLIAEARGLLEIIEKEQLSLAEYSKALEEYKKRVKELENVCHISFSQGNPSATELYILEGEVGALYGEKDADYISQIGCLQVDMDYYIPKEAYEETIYMPFENTVIPVPKGYDLLLKKKYGTDYMIPQKSDPGHDYPFFNVYLRHINEKNGKETFEQTKARIKRISTEYYHKFLRKSAKPVLEFEQSYFEDNTEEKQIWAAMLEVLEEVKRLCKDNHLHVFAIDETLDCAISEQGLISGIQDIHLAMRREEYDKFLIILQEQLDPWFDYRNLTYSMEHEDLRCYVMTDGYLCNKEEYAKRFHGCPHIVGIDIASIDEISDNMKQEDLRSTLLHGLLKTSQSMPSGPTSEESVLQVVEQWKNMAGIEVDMTKNLKMEFLKAMDGISKVSFQNEGSQVRILTEGNIEQNRLFMKEWFEEIIEVPFMNTTIPIPKDYKKILKL